MNKRLPQSTLAGNKLIAEFMGYKYYPEHILNDIKGCFEKKGKLSMLLTEFKYHSSFCEIKKAYDKFLSLSTIKHSSKKQAKELLTAQNKLGSIHMSVSIGVLYENLLEAITLYNSLVKDIKEFKKLFNKIRNVN